MTDTLMLWNCLSMPGTGKRDQVQERSADFTQENVDTKKHNRNLLCCPGGATQSIMYWRRYTQLDLN